MNGNRRRHDLNGNATFWTMSNSDVMLPCLAIQELFPLPVWWPLFCVPDVALCQPMSAVPHCKKIPGRIAYGTPGTTISNQLQVMCLYWGRQNAVAAPAAAAC